MSGWIITALLGLVLGGGGIAAFVMMGGGGIAALIAIRAMPGPRAIWAFLTHPIGVLLTMAVLSGGMWITGDIHGKRAGRAECEARIAASIAAARQQDEQVAAERARAADLQRAEAVARETAVKDEVSRYVDEVAKRTGEACRAGADADRFNDGLSVQPDQLPRLVPIPPARPGRGPVSGPVPQGLGVR